MKLPTPLVYGLIASVLLVSAPHAEHLPLWVSTLCSIMLGWRFHLAFSGNPLPPRWLLLAITAACVAGVLLGYHTLFGREVGVTFVFVTVWLGFVALSVVFGDVFRPFNPWRAIGRATGGASLRRW